MSALQESFVLLPSPSEAPGFRVVRSTHAVYSVRLWGPLTPLWTGHFSLGLSREGVNILRGYARQDRAGLWVADFLIAPTVATPDLSGIDYLALAMREHAEDGDVDVAITHYTLDGSPDQGSALYLEVRGPDRVGFLGSLLRALEELSLSPRDMTITTREGEVFDRFSLKTVSGQVPSDEARRALARRLDGMLVRA